MLRRSGFKRKTIERRPPAPPARATRKATYGGTTAAADPKPDVLRNAHLLSLARDQACQLQIHGTCSHDCSTTVACHSNLSEHGKAGARKADDCYVVFGCGSCHFWLDQNRHPTYEEKRAAFMDALARQVDVWQSIASDASRAPRDRAAAQWALSEMARGKSSDQGTGHPEESACA